MFFSSLRPPEDVCVRGSALVRLSGCTLAALRGEKDGSTCGALTGRRVAAAAAPLNQAGVSVTPFARLSLRPFLPGMAAWYSVVVLLRFRGK